MGEGCYPLLFVARPCDTNSSRAPPLDWRGPQTARGGLGLSHNAVELAMPELRHIKIGADRRPRGAASALATTQWSWQCQNCATSFLSLDWRRPQTARGGLGLSRSAVELAV